MNALDEKWLDEIPAIAKWKDKNDQLELLIEKIDHPRLSSKTNVFPLLQLCKRLLSDNVLKIQFYAYKILTILALGLRGSFRSHAKGAF